MSESESKNTLGFQMRDLRVRFGLYLALALLPLLIFSFFASLDDFKREVKARDAEIVQTSTRGAFEIVDTLDSAKAILQTAAKTVTPETCESDLRGILETFPRFDYFVVLDNTGRATCSANAVLNRVSIPEIKQHLSKDAPFHTDTKLFKNGDAAQLNAIFVTYGIHTDLGLDRIMVLGFDPSRLNTSSDFKASEPGKNLFIINSEGEEILSTRKALNTERQEWVKKAKAQGAYYDTYINSANKIRDVYITPSRDNDFFIALSSPRTSILGWSLLNPLSSIFIPLLAWVFGFIAIWLSADRLILSHLRKMRRATISFAQGDKTRRVGKLKNPPHSIYALGQNFDMMADKITEREEALRDSLEEKETLLREIHHRVKNNLQIIISLLNMQERKLKDETALSAISDTRSRINAIALVHRGLYESDDLRYVNMQTFLDRLIPELSLAFGTDEMGIKIMTQADCDPMEADIATPVALFIVEALTNSVKHGVDHGGEVTISLKQNEDGVHISVSDRHEKFTSNTRKQEDSNPPFKSGMGTKLIRGFARQLGGTLAHKKTDTGYAVHLHFQPRPLSEKELERRDLMHFGKKLPNDFR